MEKSNTQYEKPGFEKSLNGSKKTSIFRFNEGDIQVYKRLFQKHK